MIGLDLEIIILGRISRFFVEYVVTITLDQTSLTLRDKIRTTLEILFVIIYVGMNIDAMYVCY